MAETDYKPGSRFTPKERKLKYRYAKLLRDMMLKTLEEWDAMVQNELTGDHVESQSIEKIKNKILGEVNRSLVWQVLAKEDRFDTPFYNAQLEELKKEHPNLTVDNNLHCFVSLPAFNQADIDRAFINLSGIPAFHWGDEENT
jgi:hypothetical protein